MQLRVLVGVPPLSCPPPPHPHPQAPTKESILGFLEGKLAKWWLPSDVVFVKGGPVVAAVGAALRGGRWCARGYVVGFNPCCRGCRAPTAEIPHTATGKISKLTLRQQFKDYRPSASAAAASRSRL